MPIRIQKSLDRMRACNHQKDVMTGQRSGGTQDYMGIYEIVGTVPRPARPRSASTAITYSATAMSSRN